VPSADVVSATNYSSGYPAVLGYYLPQIMFCVSNDNLPTRLP
jgi:hypothetical protein